MNRSTLLLVALLVVLGVIVLLVKPSNEERETSYKPGQISLAIDSAAIVKVEIRRPSKAITIENVGGRWTVTSPVEYPADPSLITQVIGGVHRFKVGSLISSNPEKQRLFQVDSTGTRLTLTDRSGKSTSLIIGKTGPSYAEIYFRLPDSKDVYLGEGLEDWKINRDVKDWRDKTIFTAPSEAIRQITYTHGSNTLTLSRDNSGWRTGSGAVASDLIDPAVNALNNLRADDFADGHPKLDAHPTSIAIGGMSNATLTLSPKLPDSSQYYVQTSANPQTFVISKWTAEQLLKPVAKPSAGTYAAPVTAATEPPKVASPKKEIPKKALASVPPATKPATKAEAKKPEPKKIEPPVMTKATPTSEFKLPTHVTPREKRPKRNVAQNPASAQTAKETSPPPVTTETKPEATIKTGEAPKTDASTKPPSTPPAKQPSANPLNAQPTQGGTQAADDEGDLTVHTVKSGETMQTIAKKYRVTVEQILKWNLLKSISVKPGQELYIYVKK